MANLAIQGHKKRGEEVIEILKMLGGENPFYYDGTTMGLVYTISPELELDVFNINSPSIKDDYIVFTLEEFLRKYPYKVGDKVKYINNIFCIKSLQWDSDKNTVIYYIDEDWSAGYVVETDELQPYKETVDKTKFPYEIGTRVSVKSPYIKKLATIVGLSYDPCASMQYEIKFDGEDVIVHYPTNLITPITMEEQIKIDIPKGYKFVCIDDGNQQVVLEKIKLQYPKNYEECIGKLSINWDGEVKGHKNDLLYNFQKLLIARDVYWKLAGEEMGLGKPWEPDWSTERETKYVIEVYRNNVRPNSQGYSNKILAFPTKEMRDTFYENFKDLIEECKELL